MKNKPIKYVSAISLFMVFLFIDFPIPHWLKNVLTFVLAAAIIWEIGKDLRR